MTVQHRLIPEAQLHEPKGASSAASSTVYKSNGAGSGAWSKLGTDSFLGLSGDGGVIGKKLISNGSNGFTLITDTAYGTMGVSNNTTDFAISASVDPTLSSTSDYILFTGTGAPWAAETLGGVTFDTNRLIAPVAGVYEIRMWSNIRGFPSNVAKVGLKFKINNTTWSTRTAIVKSNSAGDSGNLSAFGFVSLAANDYVQLFVASTVSGDLVMQDINFTLDLKKAS